MTNQEYELLLSEYVADYRRDPVGFRKRVSSFMTLGNVVLVGTVISFLVVLGIGILALLGVSVRFGLYIAIVGGAGLWSAVLSLLKSNQPDGRVLRRGKEEPLLFDRVDAISRQLNAPRVSNVILELGVNASASRGGKLGVLSRGRCNLTLGIGLFETLKPEEMDAVIVHELAHHIHGDTAVSARVYQHLLTWVGINDSATWMSMWVPPFARWYVPRLFLMKEVFSRDNEFAADRLAGQVTSPQTMALALIRLHVATQQQSSQDYASAEEFLDAHTIGERDVAVEALPTRAAERLEPADITMMLVERSTVDDTHPSLGERLENLGLADRSEEAIAQLTALVAEPIVVTASEHYLSQDLRVEIRSWSAQASLEDALATDAKKQTARCKCQELADLETVTGLTDEEYARWASLAFFADGSRARIQVARRACEKRQGSPMSLWVLAEALIEDQAEEAAQVLEKLTAFREYQLPTALLKQQYFAQRGEVEKADGLRNEIARLRDEAEKDFDRFNNLFDTTGLVPTRLLNTEREIISRIQEFGKGFQAAYLVEKNIPAYPFASKRATYLVFKVPTMKSQELELGKLTRFVSLCSAEDPDLEYVVAIQGKVPASHFEATGIGKLDLSSGSNAERQAGPPFVPN